MAKELISTQLLSIGSERGEKHAVCVGLTYQLTCPPVETEKEQRSRRKNRRAGSEKEEFQKGCGYIVSSH